MSRQCRHVLRDLPEAEDRGVLDGFAHAIRHLRLPRGLEPCLARPYRTVPAGEPTRASSTSRRRGQPPTSSGFSTPFDLGFMRRRVRFVIAAFNWWYWDRSASEGFPTRQELDSRQGTSLRGTSPLSTRSRYLHLPDDAGSARRMPLHGLLVSLVHTAFPVEVADRVPREGGHRRSRVCPLSRRRAGPYLFEAAEAFYTLTVERLSGRRFSRSWCRLPVGLVAASVSSSTWPFASFGFPYVGRPVVPRAGARPDR